MNYLLQNQEQLQYLNTEDLCKQLQISPSTISRFWQKLEIRNLKELKLMQYNQERSTPSSRLASALSHRAETPDHHQLYLEKCTLQLQKTLQNTSTDTIKSAAEAIYHAKHVYIMAPDAAAGLAVILQYRLRRLGIELIPIKSGSEIYESMINISSEDIVLIFSFSKLLQEARILLQHCSRISCPSILFTDLLAMHQTCMPDYLLCCYRGEPNDYHSMMAPLLQLDILIMYLMEINPDSMKNMHYLEQLREQYADLIRR